MVSAGDIFSGFLYTFFVSKIDDVIDVNHRKKLSEGEL